MLEKQQQPQTCTAINDKSQGSVATSSRNGGIFYAYIVTNLLLSLPWKISWSYLAKLSVRNLTVSSAMC